MRRFARILTIPLLVALLLMGAARAPTTTWTTTADWDGGTKSEPSPVDGNLQVESNTDSLAVADGNLALGSRYSDRFTVADTDADTNKWDLTTGGACGGSPTVTRTIAGGDLTIDVLSDVGACRRGVRSPSLISGDWDIRIRQDRTITSIAPAFQRIWMIGIWNEAVTACDDNASVDGIHYFVPRSDPTTAQLSARTCVNGVETVIGANTDEPGDPQYYRMARSGDTFTWYYSSDGITWTTDETNTTAGIANPMYMTVIAFANGGAVQVSADYDDFYVAAGTVDTAAYRITGTWTSALQTYDGNVVSSITLTYSGASAAGYIDEVAIRNSLGTNLYSDGTDRTSETSATYAVPYSDALQTSWDFRVTLAGDNTATVTLQAVEIVTSTPPSGTGDASVLRASYVCTYNPLLVLVCEDRSTAYAGSVRERAWFVNDRYRGDGSSISVGAGELSAIGSSTFWLTDTVHVRLEVRGTLGHLGICDNTMTPVVPQLRCYDVPSFDNTPRTLLAVLAVAVLVLAKLHTRFPRRARKAPPEGG